MSISRLFKILTITSLCWFLLISSVFVMMGRYNIRQTKEMNDVRQLVETVFYLNWLTSDYMAHPDTRQQKQWELAQQRVNSLLASAERPHGEDRVIWQNIRDINSDLTQIFDSLRELRKRQPVSSTEDKNLVDVLVRRLSMKAEDQFSLCFRLEKQMDDRIHELHTRAFFLVSVLVMIMTLVIGWLSASVHSKVVEPLKQLRSALRTFSTDSSPVDLRLDPTNINEVEDVRLAFGQMKNRLVASYAELTRENSERVKAEQTIKELLTQEQAGRAKAEELNRLKDEFLMGLSHELRTPLNAVLGFAELIQGGKLGPEKTNDAINIIARSARAELELVNDILDLSSCMAGNMRLNVGMLNLSEITREVIDLLKLSADAKHLAIRFASNRPTIRITGDAIRVKQIIWNLLTNAIKFTPEDGRPIMVVLTAENETVRLKVSDHGIGITSQFLPFVFEKFRQQDASLTRKFGGLGVGLTLVRTLVELHGGNITAQSAGQGKGSSFTVTFPQAVAEEVASEPSSPALRSKPSGH